MQSFQELSLSAPMARAIAELGYEKPSAIQAATLPILLGEPTDFLGLAATGTGKTAAFGIPLIERLDPEARGVQALILCPTRELALQVRGQLDLLGRYKGLRTVAIYGGAGYSEQIQGLRAGASIVIGTPGRVIDHLERGTLRLEGVSTLVLDEADEMISMGFKDELEKILQATPRESSQIWLFSATMSREVRRVADTYLREPEQVQVNRTEIVPATIEQFYYPTREGDKPEVLCKLIEAAENFYGVVFCQTKALVVELTQYLGERGYKVDCLHGDKDQNARERTMDAFRSRKLEILVCTDVAARGLDVKDITHVVNYSLPRELDTYVHRIGRTARSGKTGVAMNLVTATHRRLIYQIESFTKTRMQEGRIPARREIGARRVARAFARFADQPFHQRALEVMSDEWKESLKGMSAEEVAARFLTMMNPEVFNDREPSVRAASAEPRSSQAPASPLAPPIPLAAPVAVALPPPRPVERPSRERDFDRRPRAEGFRGRDSDRGFDRGRFERREKPRAEAGPYQRRSPEREMARENRRPDRGGARPLPFAPPPREQIAVQTGHRSPGTRPTPPPDGLNRRARRALKFGTQTWNPGALDALRSHEVATQV